ncbi:hypothetical protein [Xanthovirga aplysinae]|uniref:hypothetical protein n=1 Tax=Xanthovirga aplysinae TaxID=2529853 RepID=UPI0012BD7B09|nr:hypothetical protein [Xanthovirga aplysinae]MTI29299.1 hypothetical protein [Xanthovirga aplysinae]
MKDKFSQSHVFYNLPDSKGQLFDVLIGRYWHDRDQYFVCIYTTDTKTVEELILNYKGIRKIEGVEYHIYKHIYRNIEVLSEKGLSEMAFRGRPNSFSIHFLTSGERLGFPLATQD